MTAWQPIATAPKDGTALIGACFTEEDGMTFCGAAYWEAPEAHRTSYGYPEETPPEAEGAWVHYYEQCNLRVPVPQPLTHWTPMPASPLSNPRLLWRELDKAGSGVVAIELHDEGIRYGGKTIWRGDARHKTAVDVEAIIEAYKNSERLEDGQP